jgi:phosphopantetheinyl transferase (holo-ACP synthase)
VYVGNDVVDVKEPLHPRFKEKICSDRELDLLNRSNLSPWLFWAIKEASFKAFKKVDSTIKFIPKQFIVSSDPWQCQLGLLKADIQVIKTSEYVHAIAILCADSFLNFEGHHGGPSLSHHSSPILGQYGSPHDGSNLDHPETLKIQESTCAQYIYSQKERFHVLSEVAVEKQDGAESEAVRALGSKMLEGVGYKNCQIVNKPPQVIHLGAICHDVDVTLSHDGRFIAAALLIRTAIFW